MKYLLLGDENKTLFIEDDEQQYSIKYDPQTKQWYPGGNELFNNRVGFDNSEPIDSPYRYGNSSSMRSIVEITHEEANTFILGIIDEKVVQKVLKQVKHIDESPIYGHVVTMI